MLDERMTAGHDVDATWIVRVAAAAYGFSLAVALAPKLALRARPDQLLSALKLEGYSPTGLILQFLLAVLLTAVCAIAGQRIAPLFAGQRWARVSFTTALLLAPVALTAYGNVKHIALIGVAAAAIVVFRKHDPGFRWGDAVLVPTTLACYIAFLDLGFGRTAVATSLRALIAIFALRMLIRSSDAFVLAPLALGAEVFRHPAAAGSVALLILLGTPMLLGWTKWRIPRRVVYPIVVFLYPLALLRIPALVTSNFFEDAHDVTVASEMLRGERPYTDIIPTHGLINDGVLDYVASRAGLGSLPDLLNVRLVFGMLSGVAIYTLLLAATGTADLALLAAFLTFSLHPGSMILLRPAVAIFALAATVAGTRLRARRWFVMAGALVVLACLVSIDFGLYSGIVALFAAFRARSLRPFAIGLAAAAVPSFIVFAIFGFAFDFIRVTATEILGSHSVYFLHAINIPEPLRSASIVHHLGAGLVPIAWFIALIASSAALARSPLRARRSDGPWLIGVWMIVATASWIERSNPYFSLLMTPFLFLAIWTLRKRARTVAAVLMVILVLLAEPVRHVIALIPEVRHQKEVALFDPQVTTSLHAVESFVKTLEPDETFVDFSNAGLLYALLHRDCPLRQIEVANYESEDAQRAVIARLTANRHVRAALIAFPGTYQNVDGITNRERAPLVWAWLQKNFHPAFEENGVIFWQRTM